VSNLEATKNTYLSAHDSYLAPNKRTYLPGHEVYAVSSDQAFASNHANIASIANIYVPASKAAYPSLDVPASNGSYSPQYKANTSEIKVARNTPLYIKKSKFPKAKQNHIASKKMQSHSTIIPNSKGSSEFCYGKGCNRLLHSQETRPKLRKLNKKRQSHLSYGTKNYTNYTPLSQVSSLHAHKAAPISVPMKTIIDSAQEHFPFQMCEKSCH